VIADIEKRAGHECGHVIESYVVQQFSIGAHHGKFAPALPVLSVDRIHHQIVDAVPASVDGDGAVLRERIGHLHHSRNVAYTVVADGDIRNRTLRAHAALIDGCEQDGEAGLRETAPAIFQQIGLEEHANPAL